MDNCKYCDGGFVVIKTKGIPQTTEPCAICRPDALRAFWLRTAVQNKMKDQKEKDDVKWVPFSLKQASKKVRRKDSRKDI